MRNPLLTWLSVGVMAIGISATVVSGAGAAAADAEPGSETGSSASSSTTSTDSDPQGQGSPGSPATNTDDESAPESEDATQGEDAESTGGEDAESTSGETVDTNEPVETTEPDGSTAPAVEPTDSSDAAYGDDPTQLVDAGSSTSRSDADAASTVEKAAIAPDELTAPADALAAPPVEVNTARATEPADTLSPVVAEADVVDEQPMPSTAPRLAMVSAPEPAAAAAPSLIDVIGSLVFSVYDLVLRLFEGPPVLPAGSTVTVRTSMLRFESGREIPAEWYFPDDPEPKGLIYLQHGFLAAAPFYSYTAAALAEQTNSIVVATSVTSNPFTADGFSLSGAAYQQAVAGLFTGDRNELTESASAALGQDVTLPTRFVLTGHSAGGGLALAAASHLDEAALADLAGIVMFDGVADDEVAATAFATLPDTLPIYQLAAPPYSWNANGATANALVAARPGQFNGVELVGGSHVDSTQGGNIIFQIASYLATGFSKPQNIEAVKILASGWINDMFDGTSTGIYGAPGDAIDIPTDAGTATAIVLPVGAADAVAASNSPSVAESA